jgi:hypothetical protein
MGTCAARCPKHMDNTGGEKATNRMSPEVRVEARFLGALPADLNERLADLGRDELKQVLRRSADTAFRGRGDPGWQELRPLIGPSEAGALQIPLLEGRGSLLLSHETSTPFGILGELQLGSDGGCRSDGHGLGSGRGYIRRLAPTPIHALRTYYQSGMVAGRECFRASMLGVRLGLQGIPMVTKLTRPL